MRILRSACLSVTVATCLMAAGCAQQPDPDQLRRETAQATSEVKQDAKAVAEGLREGLKGSQALDLNTASRNQLLDLPGITAERADRIIASRPLGSTGELVSRRILPQAEYDRIQDHIRVGKPSPSIQ